jgi:hypothetical protein
MLRLLTGVGSDGFEGFHVIGDNFVLHQQYLFLQILNFLSKN